MQKSYKVTVIMSNYNQERYIERAIQSVLNQKTNFPFLLIITDDFSTRDKSVEIIKKYESKYPEKIKALYNQENGRYLKNILRAKFITKTPFFCLLDADDYWTDMDYLQNAVDYLETHPEYVIYSRNVLCQKEDGIEYLYIPNSVKDTDFTMENYLNQSIFITQTTGTFFRNVIFKKGIPLIMQKAVGSISERSFEGDFSRYIMHLRYGKARYESKPSGVYRILSNGIWSRLSDFEKNLIEAQSYLDYNEYFENKYCSFFINKSFERLQKCLQFLKRMDKTIEFPDDIQKIFFQVLKKCYENSLLIQKEKHQLKKAKKIKYKILIYIYKYCHQKLLKKGYISD
ncbi:MULTISPECIES: glycosyltransferase [Campylobacter]|uniref:Glycosyltransferase n=1 Tax=Campylobacter vicugnae TaxID=1660076 RepID=A0ABZ2E864_9BACT|nr:MULTISPECIES: glycosyltransferase [unclassified Campylobacter]MCR8701965.1 glycosyltransferase [Campylobacter sp. RM12176]